MNSADANIGPLPPHLTSNAMPPPLRGLPPLGEIPEERTPIASPVAAIEAILRQPRRLMYQLRQPGAGQLMLKMLLVAAVCSIIYGFVVGSFSMGTQLWAAPVKILTGLFISGLICLPSLYIFTCLSGSEARLPEMCGLLAGLLMLMTLLLIGFAPVAWLFSQSTNSIPFMGALHLIFWSLATLFGLRFLQNGFSHSKARSVAGLNMWIIIFILVVLQMTTALRPIVGTAKAFLPAKREFFIGYWTECLGMSNTDGGPKGPSPDANTPNQGGH